MYQGKNRIYVQLSQYPGISKLLVWNNDEQEYQAPIRGKAYVARKYIRERGIPKRVSEFFEDLSSARSWQVDSNVENSEAEGVKEQASDKTFKEVVGTWLKSDFTRLRSTTQIRYQYMLGRYFDPLMDLNMSTFKAKTIDEWIEYLRSLPRTGKRYSFKHEYDLLMTILKFHAEYCDAFTVPKKKRHRENVRIREKSNLKNNDLLEEDFNLFLEQLRIDSGEMFAVMATVQYYHALRVSEAAALSWEDVSFRNPAEESRLYVRKAVKWLRKKGVSPVLENNFKNSKVNTGLKEHPLFKKSYEALLKIKGDNSKGLIFQDQGQLLTYKAIQNAYNRAFKKAGLPYTATHSLRHGGCRNLYDKTGDLSLAQQHLGNTSIQSTLVYAQRSSNALTGIAKMSFKESK